MNKADQGGVEAASTRFLRASLLTPFHWEDTKASVSPARMDKDTVSSSH